MIIILTLSTLIGVSSTSWIMVWVCLEVNTLSICWVLTSNANETNMNDTTTINYYLIQAITSIIILLTATVSNSILSSWVIVATILANIGVWPIHMWYINLINSILINQTSMLIVITWQNILPAILVISINLSNSIVIIVTIVSVTTLLTPLTNIVPRLTTNSILALSSLNSNSWIIITAMASINCFGAFLSLYTASLLVILKTVNSIDNNSSITTISFWSSLVLVANLGGIPPLTIFWSNIITLNAIISSNTSNELIFIMVLSACFMLYHYIWIMNHENMKTLNNLQTPNNPEDINSNIWWITATSWVGIILLATSGLT